jgi:hypothetical protein
MVCIICKTMWCDWELFLFEQYLLFYNLNCMLFGRQWPSGQAWANPARTEWDTPLRAVRADQDHVTHPVRRSTQTDRNVLLPS